MFLVVHISNLIFNAEKVHKISEMQQTTKFPPVRLVARVFMSVCLYGCTPHVHASSDIISVRPH